MESLDYLNADEDLTWESSKLEALLLLTGPCTCFEEFVFRKKEVPPSYYGYTTIGRGCQGTDIISSLEAANGFSYWPII